MTLSSSSSDSSTPDSKDGGTVTETNQKDAKHIQEARAALDAGSYSEVFLVSE